MFSHVVPTIIEGVFHDLYLVFGEDENSLLRKGFQQKLDLLNDHLYYEFHYEYNSFSFRLLRNKAAHGRLGHESIDEHLSNILLLDTCNMVQSDSIGLNKKIALIDSVCNFLENPNFRDVLRYIWLDKIRIPDFDDISVKVSQIEAIIRTGKFWKFLTDAVNEAGGSNSDKHGIG